MTERGAKLRQLGLLLIVWLVLLAPKLPDLDRFVAVDEVNWLHRSANFYSALMRGDFAGTLVNRTPGVITTWIGAAAFRLEAPSYAVTQDAQRTSYYMFELVLTDLGGHPLEVLHTARALMVLFISTVLLGCFYYTARLFGNRAALVGILLLAFDPFMTALSRTSHLDAPQAALMLLSLLSLSSHVFVRGRWVDLALSGAAGGMALLAKLPGIFIVPAAGLVLLVPAWRTLRQKGKFSLSVIAPPARAGAVWAAAFGLAFVLLWPAMWVAPRDTLVEMFGQAARYSSTAARTVGLEEVSGAETQELSVEEPEYSLAYFLRYPVFFLWRATPVVLAGLVSLALFSIGKQPRSADWKARLAGIWIFALIYTGGMTLPWNSSDKYFAPVFMLACLVAGLGWHLAASAAADRIRSRITLAGLLAVVLAVQLAFLVDHHPYYFTYYNPLIGGGQRASQEILVGVGEGLDVAARILDELPGSEGLRVMSWYGIGPFSYYFDGQVEPLYRVGEEVWTEAFVRELQHMDFLVIYTNQKLRGGPERLFELLSADQPEYTIVLEGIEYAWIYRVADLPLADEVERLQALNPGD
jgi:hypothetical protein